MEEPEVEQSVRTLLLCSMSMMVAPVTPTLLDPDLAEAPVKVTVPKSANVTKELPSSKSSTIHSALVSQRSPSEPSFVKVCVTVSPLVLFSMTAVPAVLLVAVTVTVMESPAEMLIPEKS